MLRDLLAFAFAWYNLPFTVLFAMGILLAGLQLTGLGAGDDAHGDAAVSYTHLTLPTSDLV